MNKKTVFKILLDVVMTILYLLLMFTNSASSFFHEFTGISVGVLFTVHVLVNRQSLAGMLRARNRGSASVKVSYKLLLDLILTIGMPIVILTGALISEVLFSTGISTAWMLLYGIHKVASYACLGALALHVLAHAKYLVTVTGNLLRQYRSKNVKKAFERFAAGTVAACILYVLAFSAYKNSLSILDTAADSAYVGTNSSTTDSKTENLVNTAASTPAVGTTPAASTDSTGSETTTTGTAAATPTPTSPSSSSTSTSSPTPTATAAVIAETLNDYLSKLFCTACHNHCPLSSPRCGRSAAQIEAATAEYNDLYEIG